MTDERHPHVSPAIRVREAKVKDLATIVYFNQALALETEDVQLDQAVLRDGVQRALDDPARLRYFVALSVPGNRRMADRVVGQIGITTEWSDWRNAFLWWIQSVFVVPSERRVGVLGKLYNHVLAQARREPDVCGIRLYVHDANERAMAAYRNLGMSASEYRIFEQLWNPAS